MHLANNLDKLSLLHCFLLPKIEIVFQNILNGVCLQLQNTEEKIRTLVSG